MVTSAAGTIAISRVTSRRSHGGSLRSRKPSITIWPAMVAVTVEFSPQQRSAIPNSVGAIAEPSKGASSVCAFKLLDPRVAGPIEGRRSEDQDRRVDRKGEHERD